MKKIFLSLALCLAFVTGLFAEEKAERKNFGLERPLRFELGYAPLLGVDFRGAYMFPINDVLRWDVGAEANVLAPGFLETLMHVKTINADESITVGIPINFLGFGSFWWWDFYVSYGLGLGVNTAGGAAFIPFDARIGWQPGARKNNRFAFKIETVLFGSTYADKRYYTKSDGTKVETESKKAHYIISPRLNLGLAVRF